MSHASVSIGGVNVPRFLYGSAWKEDRTQGLIELAIQQGFRGFDTANQRKHYFEAGVGAGIAAAVARGEISRSDLFLQTKFTFLPGQDQRLPYDALAPVSEQVRQSFASSLAHLQTDHLDSYVLHGPSSRTGLRQPDWDAWRAMEAIQQSGQVKMLGVSNVSLEQLEALWSGAKVRPVMVQNRCFAVTGWDREVRQFCRDHGMAYQGFSLLTANQPVLAHPAVRDLAVKYGRGIAQIIFRFALDVGMLPLTGTTNAAHMQADLGVFDFELEADEVRQLEFLAD